MSLSELSFGQKSRQQQKNLQQLFEAIHLNSRQVLFKSFFSPLTLLFSLFLVADNIYLKTIGTWTRQEKMWDRKLGEVGEGKGNDCLKFKLRKGKYDLEGVTLF